MTRRAAAVAPRARRYTAFGLRIRSNLALPELVSEAAQKGVRPDIGIRMHHVASSSIGRSDAARLQVDAERLCFAVPGVAAYRVENGNRIAIRRAQGARAARVRLFLLGSALGGLLHQRGLLPLHASAVAAVGTARAGSEGATLFLGPRGAGKSTLAAALLRRGHRLIADDVSALRVGKRSRLDVLPAFPRLRLRADAARMLGVASPSGDVERKRDWPVPEAFRTDPLPLARIFVLTRTDIERPVIRRLRGGAALRALVEHTHRPSFLGSGAARAEHLRRCGRVARRISVLELSRPPVAGPVGRVLELLEPELLR